MAQTENIVEASGLRKVYDTGPGRVEALNDVDVVIESGDFVSIMGHSGAGKSTLMHILGCLDRPDEGSYRLAGEDISSLSDTELSRIRASRIGFVFQTFNLIAQYSVYENVVMPFLYQERGYTEAEVRLRAERAIMRVGLISRSDHKPRELSGGEMQRVAIARALVVKPLLILADEPTGNLDSKTSTDILGLFRELNDQGATVVVVTHNDDVASHGKRILRLRDGRIESDEKVS